MSFGDTLGMAVMLPELWNWIPPEVQVIFREIAETIKRLQRVEELERPLGMTRGAKLGGTPSWVAR